MSSATMTIIGLRNFLDYQENDLFQKLELPDGIDKDLAINNILLQCGEKELLYPDSGFMIEAIGMWSKKWYRTFEKWITALNIDYNPLENYDRIENWNDAASTLSSESSSASANDSAQGSESQSNDVSAFNSDSMKHDTSSAAQTNNTAASSSNASGEKNENHSSEHEGRVHGNIGVTTSQQMLQAELDVNRFNIYDEIAIIFMREFVLAL